MFVFRGRRRDRCKISFWDRGGLVLYYKRLERGRFRMPRVTTDGRAIEMDATELMMLRGSRACCASGTRSPRESSDDHQSNCCGRLAVSQNAVT
jgi:transposase